jgi:hypothetical protein
MDLYFKIKFYEEMIGLGILVLIVLANIVLWIWSKKK